MAKLSKQYALLDFYPGDPTSVLVEPISTTVTVDETFAPYVTATVVLPTNLLPYSPDPRFPVFLGLRLQQDFGDLIYNREITADFGGDVSAITAAYGGDISDITRAYTRPWNVFEPALPISTITAAYGGDVSDLTAADLMEVWRMSDFLHSTGTFNPAPSTIFDAYLMLRSVEKDYISGETTLELTSHEAILLDTVGYPSDLIFTYTSLRDIINAILSDAIGFFAQLQPGDADYTYSPAYGLIWPPEKTAWDYLYELVTSAGLVLYCDEKGEWYLQYPGVVTGSLELKDDDNITTLTSRIDRNSPNFFDYAIVEYRNPESLPVYRNFGISGFPIRKARYFLFENLEYPGGNPAQELVWRGATRGETYEVEAISNYDARPRQNMTIDVTGEPTKIATIQSITWSLPSARMSIDIRDLTEVI
jgi:hypothetical protein